MRLLVYAVFIVSAALLLTSAKKEEKVDFLREARFWYDMDQQEADGRFGSAEKPNEDYTVLYRVDTPSTAEYACTYKSLELYLVRFYQGKCFFVERRAEVYFDQVQEVFDHYNKLYGGTPEATQSRDARLLYARWMLKDRDIEISAHQREGNVYILTYNEFDPMLLGEVLRIQERELENAGTTEIDPLTGKPRFSTHQPSGDDSGTEGEENTAEDEGGEDGDGEDGGEKKEPPPEEDDPDWY